MNKILRSKQKTMKQRKSVLGMSDFGATLVEESLTGSKDSAGPYAQNAARDAKSDSTREGAFLSQNAGAEGPERKGSMFSMKFNAAKKALKETFKKGKSVAPAESAALSSKRRIESRRSSKLLDMEAAKQAFSVEYISKSPPVFPKIHSMGNFGMDLVAREQEGGLAPIPTLSDTIQSSSVGGIWASF